MYRIFFATSSMFLSLVLGAIALAFTGINYPETASIMQTWAGSLKSAIVGSWGLAPKYNFWVGFFLQEQQLLFLFFTIAARILLAIVTTFSAWLFGLQGARST